MPNKRVRIFAGPNGSGKSSLFKELSKNYPTGYFINADEFERQLKDSGLIDLKSFGLKATQLDLDAFSQLPAAQTLIEKANQADHPIQLEIRENFIVDAEKETHSYEGSFIAAFIRYMLMSESKPFSFETVMSHPSKVTEMQEYVNLGYRLYFYFVCIDSPEVNVLRVRDRVQKGGHAVQEAKIRERYYRTLELIHQVFPLCYRAYFFDNSGEKNELIAQLYDSALKIESERFPQWFIDYVLPYYTAE